MAQVTRTQAIDNVINAFARPDLAELYGPNMECQVNVAQDGGERVEGEYNGRVWRGWSDGLTTWKSFRIPYNAGTNPEYDDKIINFDLAAHVEAIGMTGWDWMNKVSRWVAYDFDSIINHKQGLTPAELKEIVDAVYSIDWVTIRKSTSGKGYHIYVFLPEVPTENHTEHAALGRAILGLLTAATGIDFHAKVDACGGNMWVWHRKTGKSDGLELIKQGGTLNDIPINWRDHLDVVKGRSRRTLPQEIIDANRGDFFEELCGQRTKVPLDDAHKGLLEYLKEQKALWWWDNDNYMLVTHTYWLKQAHDNLSLRGLYDTNSQGSNLDEQNCYCFPMRGGAWTVRRFTPGVQEHPSWQQDGNGWTRCYLNMEPDFTTACKTFGGIKDPKGAYVFSEAAVAVEAAKALGVYIKIAARLSARKAKLIETKGKELIIEIDKEPSDPSHEMDGWLNEGTKPWTQVNSLPHRQVYEPDVLNYDELIRHLVTEEDSKDHGWVVRSYERWQEEPKGNIKDFLKSLGHSAAEADIIIGSQIVKPWKLVNKPFQSEFPGDREWNRYAAQLRFTPAMDEDNLTFPTWDKIFQHIGDGLNDAIITSGWCKVNGILTGADYVKLWLASLLQEPLEPLPYLFLFGVQNCGKSIFHEAINLLITNGVIDAGASMISQAGFNKELEGSVLCYIEEANLQTNKHSYNRIKDWVTAKQLLIHEKGQTPYSIPNSTHWVHCANNPQYCPVFPGDTRITMINVPELDPIEMIAKKQLMPMLEKEAPHLLAAMLKMEIPASNDRLNVPVIETFDKAQQQEYNQTDLDRFIKERCQHAPGYSLLFADFYDKFIEFLDPQEVHNWSKIKLGREIHSPFIKARARGTGHFHIGNIAWRDSSIEERRRFVQKDDYLEQVEG